MKKGFTITYVYGDNLYVKRLARLILYLLPYVATAPTGCATIPTAAAASTPTTSGWSGSPPGRKF